jgi:serine/threonine protein kinase
MPVPSQPHEPSLAPERLGPYRLLRPISAGGMARVYEGRFDSLAGVSTRVAIKVIHPDFANEEGFQDLFIQEARISARLEHLNVVRVQQFNREGALYYLVMEYIDGVTFRKIVSACRRHGQRLPVALLAELGRQACEGLHYAHALADEAGKPLRLVHRDMKPSNLMLNVQGVVKVLDFGISYAHGQQESRGSVKGTWGYMAPEQAEGQPVGPAADLYGLASVLYEVATLEPLFPESDNAAIRRELVADGGARRAAGLGGPYTDLAGVLVRALQRDPHARFNSAESMARALSQLVPDPMLARDELVRKVAELRALDQAAAPPVGVDPNGSAHSVSTMRSQPGPAPRPGLPVVSGSLHAPSRAPRPAAPPARSKWSGSSIFSVVFALFSVAALLFTASTILWPRGSSRPAATPVAAAPVPASPIVAAPVAAPVATPAVAPAPVVAPPVVTAPEAPEPVAAPEAPAPAPKSSGTREPTRKTTPAPATAPQAAELVRELTAPAPAAAAAEGMLSVSASPRAQILIDGQYVRFTPLFQHPVPAGTHTVLLVTADNRRKTFRVEVPAGGEVRRIWMFDEDAWSPDAAPP